MPSFEEKYLGLVDPATKGGLGQGQAYDIEVMDATIQRAIVNGCIS